MFKRHKRILFSVLKASTQTLCSGHIQPVTAASSALPCSPDGSRALQAGPWMFPKPHPWALQAQLDALGTAGCSCHHPAAVTRPEMGTLCETAALPSHFLLHVSRELCPCEKSGLWNKLYCRVLSKPRSLLRLSISLLWDKSKEVLHVSVSTGK